MLETPLSKLSTRALDNPNWKLTLLLLRTLWYFFPKKLKIQTVCIYLKRRLTYFWRNTIIQTEEWSEGWEIYSKLTKKIFVNFHNLRILFLVILIFPIKNYFDLPVGLLFMQLFSSSTLSTYTRDIQKVKQIFCHLSDAISHTIFSTTRVFPLFAKENNFHYTYLLCYITFYCSLLGKY